jgi:hypothetical protein
LASAVTRTGESFATYLDDKPPSTPRGTKFIFSGQPPSGEVPPPQPGLAPPVDNGHEVLDQYEGVDPEGGDDR